MIKLSLTSILIVFYRTLSDTAILFETFSWWIEWFWHRLGSLHHLKLHRGGYIIHIIKSFSRYLGRRSWPSLKTCFFIFIRGLFRLHMFVSAKWTTLVFGVYNIILNPAYRISLYAEGHVLSRIIL